MNFHAHEWLAPKPPGNPDLMIENVGRMVSIVSHMESQASAAGRLEPEFAQAKFETGLDPASVAA